MNMPLLRWTRGTVLLLALIAALVPAIRPARAAPYDGKRSAFADPAFARLWERTDSIALQVRRTFYWGFSPWFDTAEFLKDSPNGLRTVQYFDKARMEINNPSADRSNEWFVTTGLLVTEMVSGFQQWGLGGNEVDGRRGPADIPVAGNPRADNPTSPTYASFRLVSSAFRDYRDADVSGSEARADRAIDLSGNVTSRPDLAANRPETELTAYNVLTGHNIPRVFLEFLAQEGPFVENGRIRRDDFVINPVYAMGNPITDPYWVRAKVGAQEKDVLVQLFERRALTYVPDNEPGYRVEVGNVGQHYFQWRYPQLGQPWTITNPDLPMLFARNLSGGSPLQTFLSGRNRPPYLQLTNEQAESIPFSYQRSYDPAQVRVLFDSKRGDGSHRQIYVMEVPPLAGDFQRGPLVERLTYSDSTPAPVGKSPTGLLNRPANDYNPAASPDGTKIAFVSDRSVPELYMMYSNGEGMTPIWSVSGPERPDGFAVRVGCASQYPSWTPDGRGMVWEYRCDDGRWRIVRGDLDYQNDQNGSISVRLVNLRPLTDGNADNRYPRLSPDGSNIAFTSYRDGNGEIYVMNADGSNQRRLTSDAAEDEAPAWDTSGLNLVFASNRSGNYRIYIMRAAGGGLERFIPNTSPFGEGNHDERWPAWGP